MSSRPTCRAEEGHGGMCGPCLTLLTVCLRPVGTSVVPITQPFRKEHQEQGRKGRASMPRNESPG